MKIFLLVFMFFTIACLLIISNYDLEMNQPENISKFVNVFSNWTGQVASNTVTLTGNVIKLSWMPK